MSDVITYEPYHFDEVRVGEEVPVLNTRLLSVLKEAFGDAMEAPSAERLLSVSLGLALFLSRKNRAYGDAALKPLRVFSKASTEEQLRVRLDDKLSRLARGEDAGEDVIVDLAGYLILLLAAREND